jgi:hypothetical protein
LRPIAPVQSKNGCIFEKINVGHPTMNPNRQTGIDLQLSRPHLRISNPDQNFMASFAKLLSGRSAMRLKNQESQNPRVGSQVQREYPCQLSS